MTHELSTFSSLDEEGMQLLWQRLLQLLGQRLRYDTLGDSSSVPIERAQALLSGISFALKIHLRHQGLSDAVLLRGVLATWYDDAIHTLLTLKKQALTRYQQVCATLPVFPNRAFQDTIRELDRFFHRYDVYSLPQEIPCMIDYPLCLPVDDKEEGICWIQTYLDRLLIENRFLICFTPKAIADSLYAYCIDPKDQLINLYEAVTEVLIRKRLGSDLPTAQKLRHIAEGLLSDCKLKDSASHQYLMAAADTLLPRLVVSSSNGRLMENDQQSHFQGGGSVV